MDKKNNLALEMMRETKNYLTNVTILSSFISKQMCRHFLVVVVDIIVVVVAF